MTRLPALLAAVLAGLLALAGCSSSSDADPSADESASPTAASGSPTSVSTGAVPYLPVPEGVELTEPGSQLSVGEHAVLAYHPRQDEVAAIDVAVTKLEKTSMKAFSAWQLTGAQKRSTPYYVRAKIENVGETDLGGRRVPLYVVNEDNLLLEPTPFASSFKPCPSTPFPKKFAPGDTTRACLVYLAPKHGDLVAVSFRPEESFNPITWTGEVQRYQPTKPGKKHHKQGKKGKRQPGKKAAGRS